MLMGRKLTEGELWLMLKEAGLSRDGCLEDWVVEWAQLVKEVLM